jgi:hypothetical protein
MYRIEDLVKRSDKETAFVILLCRLYLQTAGIDEVHEFLKNNTINYERFHYLARKNQVRPVILKVIQQHAIVIKDSIRQQLVKDVKTIALNNLKNLSEMTRVIALFEEKGIPLIPYKGTTFAKLYYGNWGLRESTDIDFLVVKADVPKIQEIIYKEGYQSPPLFHYCTLAYQLKYIPSFDVNNDSENQRNFHLEFHYHIINKDFAVDIDNSSFMSEHATLSVGDKDIAILTHEAHCKIILTHHGLDDIWIALKYYLDLAMISKKGGEVNWENILAFCRENGYYTNACCGFKNMELLLGITNPVNDHQPDEKLSEQILNICLQHDRYKYKYLKKTGLRIMSRDGFKWRVKMIWRLFFVRVLRPKDLDFKFIALPDMLYPLYYILKPFRIFYKYVIGPLLFNKKDNKIFR